MDNSLSGTLLLTGINFNPNMDKWADKKDNN